MVNVKWFPGGFRKAICSSYVTLKQLLNATARGVRVIRENSSAFCKGLNKIC
jgi:hypothetical protein